MIDLGSPAAPRWLQRFANFDRAFVLLREGVDLAFAEDAHPILREALVQRFEYTWDLAWKTLKDYLEFEKVTLTRITAKEVIRTALAARYIDQGEAWMAALDARNAMSHVYDLKIFESTANDIRTSYLPLFEAFHQVLATARSKLGTSA